MKLIDKSALVAEIERLKDEYLKHSRNKVYAEWSCGTLDNILSFLDSLEVKEVNLEKEINEHWDEWAKEDGFHSIDFAKYFFELGLKAQKGEEI